MDGAISPMIGNQDPDQRNADIWQALAGMAGWLCLAGLAGWLGLAGLAGWLGWLGWLAG